MMLRTRYGGNKTLLVLIGVVLLVAAMPGVRSQIAPAASADEDRARSFATKAAPNCWRAAARARTSKNGDRVLTSGSMGCRVDPPPSVRVVVKLQQRVRSGGDFVFSTKRTATATSIDWVSGRTSMRCHPGTFRSLVSFLYRVGTEAEQHPDRVHDQADRWSRFHSMTGPQSTIRRC